MDAVLQRLIELDEIQNALIVGKDGLIVSGMLHNEDEEMMGAMSAAAFGSVANYTNQISSGEARHVMVEAKTGTIHMEGAGDLILIVSTRGVNNPGRIRLEMKKACQQLVQLVGNY
ncbi:MAG TPA: roadblock/LC7 domain-containing protein [Ktedonobacteraceae bacterium]|nr:roadblock/LC7 domain-containing protein [Ktedonobacteraceae bacterium]